MGNYLLFSKAAEYALIATIYIAKTDKPEGVDALSKSLNISKSFLAKILQNLAKQGILISYKGAKGGFALAKDMTKISVIDIVRAADIGAGVVFSCTSVNSCCTRDGELASLCGIWPLMNKVQFKVDDVLRNTKLDDLIRE
jgi:Rrf2 family protein